MSQHQQDPKAIARVMQRASVDRTFRERLLREPQQAIRAAFGVVIPDFVRLKFIEKGHDVDALVVLPDFVGATGELSEDDLSTVAGGVESDFSWSEELPPDEVLP
jgi:hypothetical protein